MRPSEVCDMIVLNEAFFLMVKTSKKKMKFESCYFILILDIHYFEFVFPSLLADQGMFCCSALH